MYLKALKLHGFKSFADQTELRFEPGVTAVVGPNGCGKSNIADAIRWVLGEQSAKALRGGKMQDVIFEGTDTRKPHAMCEVSLLLTECEKQLGTEFHEVEITRRVTRDGTGEYFLNGQSCRLKDIQKLFMDTGVGRTSYSIMAQGHIDSILSSKPEERRSVFEEAAGITRYKSQRREALNKLALTEQNLARVADVIGEVGRQIGTLRRQAAKAMRYRRLTHRLRHLSLAHDAFHFASLSKTVDDLAGRLEQLRTAADQRRTQLNEHQQTLESQKLRRSEFNQRLQDAQQSVFDLRSQKDQSSSQAHLASVRRQGLIDRLRSAQEDLSELEMQLKEVSARADTGQQDKQLQLSLLGESDSTYQAKNREVALAEGELSKAEAQLQKLRFQLLEIESRVARLRTDSSALEVDQKTAVARHEQLVAEIAEARLNRNNAAAAFAELQSKSAQAREAQTAAQSDAADAQRQLSEATQNFREAQRRLQELDRALAQKSARLKLLQQLQEKWEGFGEGAKALLQGRFSDLSNGSRFTAFAVGLAFKPEFAKAAEALLGGAVEAIQVADLTSAHAVLTRLENEKIGSACIHVPVSQSGEHAAQNLPPTLKPALNILADEQAEHPARAFLSACYVADSLEAFLSFWKETPDFSFMMVATPKGEWVDRRGLVFGGYQKRPQTSIVQREIDLREVGHEVVRDQAAHDEQKTLIDSIAAALALAEEGLAQKRAAVQTAGESAARAHAEERGGQRSLEDATNRLTRIERDIAAMENTRREAELKFQKAAAELAQAETAISQQREAIANCEGSIGQLRADRDGKREILSHSRLELAERRQKVEILDRGLGEMQKRRGQLTELLNQRRSEIDLWTEQVEELKNTEATEMKRGAELTQTLEVAQQSVEVLRVELSTIEREITSCEANQSHVRTESDRAAAELNQCEVKLAETRARTGFMAEEALREFQADLGSVDWRRELWLSDSEPEGIKPLDLDEDEDSEETAALDAEKPRRRSRAKAERGEPTDADFAAMENTAWEPIRSEVQALRQRVQGMGAVNLVAIEEYAELKQRYEFLKTQSDDLISSKDQLLKAIDEINQTSLQQFQLTFEQIRKNFEFTFNMLFGGGRAALELTQGEDPLECGIDIIAQPPGTKLKSITLLSGGQKTLTAVALLFALYMVKPSPFCLLDELDAPLDESNIGRFTGLLKQFTENSQFIIITHNKRTIAAANAIYGVTMEERGVSKTVSMRFNAEQHADSTVHLNIADSVRTARAPRAELTTGPATVPTVTLDN